MTRQFVVVLLILVGGATTAFAGDRDQPRRQEPPGRFCVPGMRPVTSARAAIRIAKTALIAIYGAASIARQNPFRAVLKDGLWIVRGAPRRLQRGGGAEVKIDRCDGVVVDIARGK
jgi:hypothetical protein